MVRITASVLSAAVVLSGIASAAPTKRQDIAPIVPAAAAPSTAAAGGSIAPVVVAPAGAGADAAPPSSDGLNSIDLSGVPTGVVDNGSLGAVPPTAAPIPPPVQPSAPVAVPAPIQPQPPVVGPSVPLPPSSGSGYNYPIYGSGSSNWMSQYNSCVETCFASYPPPPTQVVLPPSSYEGGNVWNVMVSPLQGSYRFMPSFVSASAGDIVRFTWGSAGSYSIFQSSADALCTPFEGGFSASGSSVGFTHDYKVVDSSPVYFGGGDASQCSLGMFGGINLPQSEGGALSVGTLFPQWAQANPDFATSLSLIEGVKGAPSLASSWGNNLDLTGIPSSLYPGVASSILYTRNVVARNPGMVSSSGVFNPQKSVSLPGDFSLLLSTAMGGYGNNPSPAASGPTAAQDNTTPQPSAPNSASSTVVSRAAVVGLAILTALLAL